MYCPAAQDWNSKKIAFVKQVIYQDLYCNSIKPSASDLIFSSFLRSGPVALFTRCKADFYIVEVEADEECNIWKESCLPSTECKFDINYLLGHRNRQQPNGKLTPGDYAVRCDTIDWSKYDIVITINAAVPARITSLYPSVLWAYYIGEHTMPSHQKSYKLPINGYDVFLTQDYHESPALPGHVIDFPYHLHYYGCSYELFTTEDRNFNRHGMILDGWSFTSLSEDQRRQLDAVGKLNQKSYAYGPLKDFIVRIVHSKYFIVFLGQNNQRPSKKVRGNAIPEAIAAGNLVIVKSDSVINKDLLTPRTQVDSFEELIDRIRFFENSPEEYKIEVTAQRQKLNWLCFERPIKELYKKHDDKLKLK